jgi:hypothetical protein
MLENYDINNFCYNKKSYPNMINNIKKCYKENKYVIKNNTDNYNDNNNDIKNKITKCYQNKCQNDNPQKYNCDNASDDLSDYHMGIMSSCHSCNSIDNALSSADNYINKNCGSGNLNSFLKIPDTKISKINNINLESKNICIDSDIFNNLLELALQNCK